MAVTGSAKPSPTASLVGITVRRSVVSGRAYLVYGAAMSAVLGLALGISKGSAFPSAFPILLPVFCVTGSMGALIVFTGDRTKGVLEYLLAYGISPRRLFANVLASALALCSVVLAVAVGVGVGAYLARGHEMTPGLAALLGLYGIPMSYASAAFAATVGVYWSALSSPRAGLNSPVGLAPFIGILPSVLTLLVLAGLAAGGSFNTSLTVLVLAGAIGGVGAVVLLLLALIGRLLRRERLLSPA